MGILDEIKKQSPEAQIELIKHYQRCHYKSSLYLTAKHLLGYKDINTRTHGDVIGALESPINRKLLCLPRGTFKSSIASISYPIWLLLNDPNERILIDSELYTNSKNYLREIKSQLLSDDVVFLFGNSKDDSCWNEGEILIKQRTKVAKEASITAGGVETEKTGQHYTTVIMDDLNSPNNSGTSEGLEKVWNHYRMMTSILEPGGKLVLVGTRYSESDAIGMTLRDIIKQDDEKL